MGLPTNLPGGDNRPPNQPQRPPTSQSRSDSVANSSQPKTKRTIADLTPEERRILVKRRAAKKAAEEARAQEIRTNVSPDKAKPRASAPPVRSSQSGSIESNETRAHLETKIDPKTGKEYKALPKVVANGDGFSDLAVADFDLDNLGKEADNFMAHLRVPPNRAEMDEIRAKKRAMEKKQKEEYEEEAKRIAQAEGDDKDEAEESDTSSKGFFRKLFNK